MLDYTFVHKEAILIEKEFASCSHINGLRISFLINNFLPFLPAVLHFLYHFLKISFAIILSSDVRPLIVCGLSIVSENKFLLQLLATVQ